jgi:transposase
MIGPSGAVRVMVATRPVDFRKGAEGLSALVCEIMAADPFSGTKAARPPSGLDWVHEIKHDGSRVRCFTRNGHDWADRFPAIVDAAPASGAIVPDRRRGDRADLPSRVSRHG